VQSRTSFFLWLTVLSFLFAMLGGFALDLGLTLTHARMGMIVGAGCIAFCSFFAWLASFAAQR